MKVVAFLTGKEIFETLHDFSYVRLYGFKEKRIYYLFMSLINFSQLKFTDNIIFWHTYLMKNGRSNPFHYLGKLERSLSRISHLDEFDIHFDHFKLREIHKIWGFDPNDLFTTHTYVIGYGSSFIKSTQLKEGGVDNHNPWEATPKTTHDDIDTLINTND